MCLACIKIPLFYSVGAGVCGTVAPVWLEAPPPPNGSQVCLIYSRRDTVQGTITSEPGGEPSICELALS
jgi:hypothetical protein